MSKRRDHTNVDLAEVAKFKSSDNHWWDTEGDYMALHDINPTRLAYINDRVGFIGKRVLDVGCGGGILSEGMAKGGAAVIGIDLSLPALSAARSHGHKKGLTIDYACITAEGLAELAHDRFDIVTCMELLEHVPHPESLVTACARLVQPGGNLFFATINRTPLAYLLVVLAAEYIFGIVRKGMHHYQKFIRPIDLEKWGSSAGLTLQNLSGFYYLPFIRKSGLCRSVSMNYMMHFKKGPKIDIK